MTKKKTWHAHVIFVLSDQIKLEVPIFQVLQQLEFASKPEQPGLTS